MPSDSRETYKEDDGRADALAKKVDRLFTAVRKLEERVVELEKVLEQPADTPIDVKKSD